MTDQELIAALDSRFAVLDGRFAAVDARFEALTEQLDRRFEQIDRRFEQVDSRFERIENRLGNVETEVRQWHVQLEGLRDETRRIAESVFLVDEKLERFRLDTTAAFEELRS